MLKSLFQNHSNTTAAILSHALFLSVLVLLGTVNPMAVVFAYVLETIIIGLFHAVKLFFIIRYNNVPGKKETNLVNYFSIIFFLIHYGIFVVVQSTFLYTAFATQDARFSTSLSLDNIGIIFNLDGFSLVIISIVVTHLAAFFLDFLNNKKYLNQNFGNYFMKPYSRIFIQQFLAIIPFFFLIFTKHVGILAALLLIAMRTFLDLFIDQLTKNPDKMKKWSRHLSKNNTDKI